MPGGFARILPRGDEVNALIGTGDLSADVCVVDARPSPPPALRPGCARRGRGGGILASQSADNLFWFARYRERAEFTCASCAPFWVARSTPMPPRASGRGGHHADRPVAAGGAIRLQDAPQSVIVCASALEEAELPGGVPR
jgi:hypothetical protein